MKATIYLAALLILIAAPAAVQAQYYGNNHNNLPDNDVSLSEGIVTLEEINGWAGKGGADATRQTHALQRQSQTQTQTRARPLAAGKPGLSRKATGYMPEK